MAYEFLYRPAFQVASTLAVLGARPWWDIWPSGVSMLDHIEQRLIRSNYVQVMVNIGLDMVDDARPFHLTQIGVNNDNLSGRDNGH